MREKIEKLLFGFGEKGKEKPEKPSKEERKMEKQDLGLVSLKKEIKELVQKYSAETFGEAKKKKTKELSIGEKEGIMKEYPAKKYNFRERDWFQKLTPEEQETTEFEIMNFIHQTAREELKGLINEFLEKLPRKVKKYFKKNSEFGEKLPPPKKLEEKVIGAIEEYKKYFGFPPGDPYTLEPNCAGFTNFVGRLFEHCNFKSGQVSVIAHGASLVELKGNKRYVSDINISEPLPLREWIEIIKEVKKIEARDIIIGYFGGYESNIHFNFGDFLRKLKRYAEAEKEFREAIRINPNAVEAHVNLGALFVDLERFPEAEKEFRKAIEINPNLADPHYNLGFLYKQRGEIDKAREELFKAKKLYEEKGMEDGVKKCKILLKIPENLPK